MRRFSNNFLYVAAVATISIIMGMIIAADAAAPSVPGVSKQRFPLKSEIDYNNQLDLFKQEVAVNKKAFMDGANAVYQAGALYPNAGQGADEQTMIGNTAPFIRLMYSILSAIPNLSVRYAYVSSQLAGTSHWTDVGVVFDQTTGLGSYFTNSTGYWKDFSGDNINGTPSSVGANGWTESADYTVAMKGLTSADSAGKFLTPYMFTDVAINKSYALVTYTIPLRFDSTGKCTAAASIDMDLDVLRYLIFTGRATTVFTEGIVLEASTSNWKFVTGTYQMAFKDNGVLDYPAGSTPNPRVNSFYSAVQTKLGSNVLATGSSDMTATSWSSNGFNYQAVSMYPYLFTTRTPQTLMGAKAAGNVLNTFHKQAKTTVNALVTFLSASGNGLMPNAMTPWTSLDTTADFVQSQKLYSAMGNMILGAAGMFKYIYLSYALPNGNQWGDLGVEHGVPSLGDQFMYYSMAVASNGTRYDWRNTNASTLRSQGNSTTEMENYIQMIANMNNSVSASKWDAPVSWTDDVTGRTSKVTTYTTCIQYNTTGNCKLALSVDLDINWLLNATRDHLNQEYSTKGSNVYAYWGPTGQFMWDTTNDGATWKNTFPFYNATPSTAINNQNNYIHGQVYHIDPTTTPDLSFPCASDKCTATSVVNMNFQMDYTVSSTDAFLIIVEIVPVSSITVNGNWFHPGNTPGVPMMIQELRNMRATTVNAQFATDTLTNMVNGMYSGLETPAYALDNTDTTTKSYQIANAFLMFVNTFLNNNAVPIPLATIRILYNLTGTSNNMKVGVTGCTIRRGSTDMLCFYTSADNSQLKVAPGNNNPGTGSNMFPYSWSNPDSNVVQFRNMCIQDYMNVTMKYHGHPMWQPLRTFTDQWGNTRQLITNLHGDWFHMLYNPNNYTQTSVGAVDWKSTVMSSMSGSPKETSVFSQLFGTAYNTYLPGPGDMFIVDLQTQTFLAGTPVGTFFNRSDSSTFNTFNMQSTPIDRLNVIGAIVSSDLTSQYQKTMTHHDEMPFAINDKGWYAKDGFNYYLEFCWNFVIVTRVATVYNIERAQMTTGIEIFRSNALNTISTTLYGRLNAANIVSGMSMTGMTRLYDRFDMRTQELVNGMASMLLAFKGLFLYNYGSYAIYNQTSTCMTCFNSKTVMWGDIGCEYLSTANPNGGMINCMLINATGYRYDFYGSNITSTPASVTAWSNTAAYDYTMWISNMTQTTSAVWQPPTSYTDPVSLDTNTLLTQTQGVMKGGSDNKVIVAFSIDIMTDPFSAELDKVVAKDIDGGYLEYITLGYHPKGYVLPLTVVASDLKTAQSGDKGQSLLTFAAGTQVAYGYMANWTQPVAVYDNTMGFVASFGGDYFAFVENLYVGSGALNPDYNGGVYTPSASGLSVGAIVGIVIGAIVFLALVGFLVYKKKQGAGRSVDAKDGNNQQFQYANMQETSQV